MTEKASSIQNSTGMHARPASDFAETAKKFKSKITVKTENGEGDARSVLRLMSLNMAYGTKVTISANGPDEKEAVDALVALLDSKFGEK